MAVFEYKGFDQAGKGTAGVIDAESPRHARTKLRESGVFPTDLAPVRGGDVSLSLGSSDRIPLKELAIITRQLSTLIKAGMPLMDSLTALLEQAEKPISQKIFSAVRDRVREGTSLAEALGQHPKTFSSLYREMVRAGEASGTLDMILLRLAQYLENQVTLRSKIVSILAYPVLMMIVSGLILILLIAFVVPRVTGIFADLNRALPWPTVLLLAISDFFRHFGFILILFGLFGFVLLKRYLSTPNGRWQYDRITLRLPLVGRMYKILAISRFAKTLATLLVGGVPLLSAMAIVQQVVGNKVIEEAVGKAREEIREGEGIAGPLKKSGLFPPMLTHLIAIGEQSGQLEPMLEKVAESYDTEVETTVTTVTSLLGPMLILLMGAAVLFIVLAVLLPIFDLSQIVQ